MTKRRIYENFLKKCRSYITRHVRGILRASEEEGEADVAICCLWLRAERQFSVLKWLLAARRCSMSEDTIWALLRVADEPAEVLDLSRQKRIIDVFRNGKAAWLHRKKKPEPVSSVQKKGKVRRPIVPFCRLPCDGDFEEGGY